MELPLHLKRPWDGWLHPELRSHLQGLRELLLHLESIYGNIPRLEDLEERQKAALDWFEGLPRPVEGALSIPLIHPEMCDELLSVMKDQGGDLAPNPQEAEAYRIPELVLQQKMPELYEPTKLFAERVLYLICKLFWGREPEKIRSIQLAKYTPDGTRMTGWHHDDDSNMTAVVNLAPELYTGGGTDFRTGIMTYEYVPPVQKGHALVFNGYNTLHRGAPVETGERNILVFWMMA